MLGFTFLKSKNELKKIRQNLYSIENIVQTNIVDSENTKAYFKVPGHYPFSIIQFNTSSIIIEGAIYNADEQVVNNKIEEIAKKLSSNGNYKELIISFQKEMVGEYLVTIAVDPDFKKVVFFNDYFGRLAVHYYCDDSLCMVSRNIQDVIEYLPSLIINKNVLTDLVLLGYPLNKDTLFEKVKYFDCGEIHEFDVEKFLLTRVHAASIDLTYKSKYKNRKDFVSGIKTDLLRTVHQATSTIHKRKRKILCDLSGGFDTRTVFGCLQALNIEAKYVSNDILGNESEIAARLLHLFKVENFGVIENGKPFYQNFSNESLTFITNCTASLESTRICLEALKPLHQKYSKDDVRIGGIGFTDFIRKGYRDDSEDLLSGLVSGKFNGISLKNACSMAGTDPEGYYQYLNRIISSWPERSNEGKHKKLFFRRTLVMQSRLPDDRERLDFWVMHPMWDHRLCLEVLRHFSLNWRGYYTHSLLLKAIDERLVQIPVDKPYINFRKMRKMYFNDLKDNSESYRKFRDTVLRMLNIKGEEKRNILIPKFVNLGLACSEDHSQFDISYLTALDNYLGVIKKMR